MQACVAYQGELAALQASYEDSQAELAALQASSAPDSAIMGTLGASDALLVALYAGGVLWRRHFGHDGPVYPVDR